MRYPIPSQCQCFIIFQYVPYSNGCNKWVNLPFSHFSTALLGRPRLNHAIPAFPAFGTGC